MLCGKGEFGGLMSGRAEKTRKLQRTRGEHSGNFKSQNPFSKLRGFPQKFLPTKFEKSKFSSWILSFFFGGSPAACVKGKVGSLGREQVWAAKHTSGTEQSGAEL